MKVLSLLLVLTLILFAGCTGVHHPIETPNLTPTPTPTPTPTTPIKDPDAVVVKISTDPRGKPHVDKKCAKVRAGDYIVWTGLQDFSILFGTDGNPFGINQFSDGPNKYTTNDAAINLIVPRKQNSNFCDCGEPKDRVACYKYDVIVNNIRLDPHLVIIEQ